MQMILDIQIGFGNIKNQKTTPSLIWRSASVLCCLIGADENPTRAFLKGWECFLQDRGHVWKGSQEEENVFQGNGTYEPDDPSTEEVKFHVQEPEENVFDDLEVKI